MSACECVNCVRVCLRADDGGDDSRGELGEAGGDEASHTRSSRTLLGAGACGGGWGTEREAAAVVERSARPSPRGPHAVRCERCPLRSALQCSWRATGYGVLLALGERVAPFFHSFLPSHISIQQSFDFGRARLSAMPTHTVTIFCLLFSSRPPRRTGKTVRTGCRLRDCGAVARGIIRRGHLVDKRPARVSDGDARRRRCREALLSERLSHSLRNV